MRLIVVKALAFGNVAQAPHLDRISSSTCDSHDVAFAHYTPAQILFITSSPFFDRKIPPMSNSPHDKSSDPTQNGARHPRLPLVANLLFASRWLQLPLYLGLAIAQGVYVVHFLIELFHLVEAAFGMSSAVQELTCAAQQQLEACKNGVAMHKLTETTIMLVVLGLIDVVMISNLLIMVIVGGYETFVSRMNLHNHPDQPEWLSHVNAGVLKVKLATAIIGISSIHLLKTFINADAIDAKTLIAQTGIHLVFLFSALAIAWTEKVMGSVAQQASTSHPH